jgi:hypothetical protein
MSKNACSQGHFCEAVNGQGEQSERRQSRKGLQSKTFLQVFYHEQKCLLARAFLRSRQWAGRAERAAAKPQRLAKQDFPAGIITLRGRNCKASCRYCRNNSFEI